MLNEFSDLTVFPKYFFENTDKLSTACCSPWLKKSIDFYPQVPLKAI